MYGSLLKDCIALQQVGKTFSIVSPMKDTSEPKSALMRHCLVLKAARTPPFLAFGSGAEWTSRASPRGRMALVKTIRCCVGMLRLVCLPVLLFCFSSSFRVCLQLLYFIFIEPSLNLDDRENQILLYIFFCCLLLTDNLS